MVIMRTSATEVSIQAVSPEFGVQFSSTAFFGSGLAAQAGGLAASPGAAAGAAAGAAGAVAGAGCAYAVEWSTIGEAAKNTPPSALSASAMMPARVSFLNVMLGLL